MFLTSFEKLGLLDKQADTVSLHEEAGDMRDGAGALSKNDGDGKAEHSHGLPSCR